MKQQEVKNCKNCTISEVWVQITGMPKEYQTDATNPYPLFTNLQKYLESKKDFKQTLLHNQMANPLINVNQGSHKISLYPPFWNGEIRWTEEDSNQKKIVRTGHQFFSLHSIFNVNSRYQNYESSFEKTLKNILEYIEDKNSFDAVQITVRYINNIEMKKDSQEKFNVGHYLNANFSYKLNQDALTYNLNCELRSSLKEERIIGINTMIKAGKDNNIATIVQTTGVDSLTKSIRLNNLSICDEIKKVKQELKQVFFSMMTNETKKNIMGVEYE